MGSDLIRMTGMVSGMDTESIINMYSSKTKSKLQKAKNSKQLNTWKQDAWKDLNSKIYSFYNKTLSNSRLSGAYKKAKTVTSDGALSVTGNEVQGMQNAKIVSMAKSGYMTSAKLNGRDGDLTDSSSLTEQLGIDEGTQLKFKVGDGAEKTIQIGGTATDDSVTVVNNMKELVNTLKKEGVNANFDETNQRLFISSQDTGAKNNFNFIAGDDLSANNALNKLGLLTEKQAQSFVDRYNSENGTELTANDFGWNNLASKQDATNAQLILNGAQFESDSNTFNINGATYTINYEPKDKDQDITVNTTMDYDGIYDAVKSLLKEYNGLVNEMSKLFNAESAKDYDPLTDEQKDQMSEKEIDEWEGKIKGAILRKDSTLSDVLNSVTDIMSQGIEIGGQKLSLADFGISTQSYFEANANERYALHIDGDTDDEVSGGKTDKLKAMIAKDPEQTMKFFQELSSKLYDKLYEKMSSNKSTSTLYKVYNDKQLTAESKTWDTKISELEQKVTDIEDKWYKRFSKMETKLAKMQKNQTAVSGFFGG